MLGGFKPNPTKELNRHIVHFFLCLENTYQEAVHHLLQEENAVFQSEQSSFPTKVNNKKDFGPGIFNAPFIQCSEICESPPSKALCLLHT